ncbi:MULTISPECIES: aldolase/citrate lyase family protein [unclassified Sphingomonas]|uniref:aldolase/citrate lyase family protein n=1 Tax=unclassified Sphingomonas TaxID=196159 RepID=UPI000AA93F04|nr:aldolase/citrate lyase family protein [Sphingomonas sp. Leaf30]MBD8552702.1 aldolase [Sphingomonas sp. CFBP 8764]
MNTTERRMLEALKRGRDQHGVVAVKAEFEAEGTRPDEFHRLLEIAQRADVKVALKIGGCEAVSDLLATKVYGVDYVIAPMVETAYALTKFIEAKNKTHGSLRERTEFLYNLETETTLRNMDEMLPIAKGGVDGIVFGRVDFTLSRGLPRTAINDRQITDAVLKVAHACAENDLELVVGGSVSVEAIDALREIQAIRLDRFETRKVIFDGSAVNSSTIEDGIANAVEFELAWLTNKRDYYAKIAHEDAARIDMMEARMNKAAAPKLKSVG